MKRTRLLALVMIAAIILVAVAGYVIGQQRDSLYTFTDYLDWRVEGQIAVLRDGGVMSVGSRYRLAIDDVLYDFCAIAREDRWIVLDANGTICE